MSTAFCRMPEMVKDEKWGECTKCLRWHHMDKCLSISQNFLEGLVMIGFALTVYLGNIHLFLYHDFIFIHACTF